MTVLGAVDVVHHLLDRDLPGGITAHQALIAAIGAGLGLVNLGVGYLLTRRALRHGMKSAMATLTGGFIARLFVVVSLMILFRRTDSIDPAAFALTFLVFFFVYLGLEMLLVERSLAPTHGGTARRTTA